jgi:hypothetical protein
MTTWYEVIVTGTEDTLRGFVAACEAARGGKEVALYGDDLEVQASRFSERLRDLFAAGSHHLLFAPPRLTQELVTALRSRGEEAGLELDRLEEVLRARMPFSAEAFSREVAEEIKQKLLMGLPPGVASEGLEESEEVDPSAHGAELYTPEHEFVYRVAGTFAGPLPGIAEMRRRARHLPFVKVEPLELETRPVESGDKTPG